jgi:membrane peptidoglycan carboxypeptidase
LAFFFNSQRSKSAIFYTYLHDSYFGYRLEGCEITARFLFDKPAILLTEDEASFLASLLALPLPKRVYEIVTAKKTFRFMAPSRIIEIGELQNLL